MLGILGLGLSYLYIFGLIGLAGFLLKRGVLESYATRKLVHIGVSHWWLIMMATMADYRVAFVGPVSFVLMNLLSLRFGLFKGMEDPEPRRNYGTVYFPVALVLLLGASALGLLERFEAGVGVMVLGWGDGLAALAGRRFGGSGFSVLGSRKSLVGTAVMILASSLATLAMSLAFAPGLDPLRLLSLSLAVGLAAGVVELATPYGLDNLSLPLAISFAYRALLADARAGGWLALALCLAIAANALVAALALVRGSVDPSGAVTGTGVGAALLAAGGIPAFLLLMGFFLSSTLIGRATRSRRPESGIEAKGGRRDGLQVLANCGAATAAALGWAAGGGAAWLVALGAGFAAANADTWASELGVLSKARPRDILRGAALPPGASGGVSALGFLASLLGSAAIVLLFAFGFGRRLGAGSSLLAFGIVLAAGFLGSVLDSVLGSLFQASYRCAVTGRLTERPRSEGRPNVLEKGFAWFTNDLVNLLASFAAALGAGLAFAGLA